MRIVFLNQYYPPDAAPTGVMLEAVAEKLVAEGHEVTVICAEGGYAGKTQDGRGDRKQERGGGRREGGTTEVPEAGGQGPRVVRIGATRFGRGTFAGKLLDYFSYYVGVAWKLGTMRPAPERIVALTTPPYLSVLARVFSKIRGGDHAHWVMDIYPDVMVAHGMLREGGLGHRLLAWLARWGWGGKRCVTVLTLGPCMAERLRRLLRLEATSTGTEATSNLQPSTFILHHVPLWSGAEPEISADEVQALRAARGWAEDEVVVMYSGNMGLGHRFGELFEAIREISESCPGKFRFVFFGKGRRRGEVEAFQRANPDLPVELHDYVAEEELAAHLRSADVHVASLDPAWTGTMLPSKLQGIFAAGRAVIFIGGEDSSMAGWVRESGAGWVVPQENVQALVAALRGALDRELLQRKGERAGEFGETRFEKRGNVSAAAASLVRPPFDTKT